MAKKPMTMKEWEKSPMDKKLDKKSGLKEGSKKEQATYRKALAKENAKRAKKK